MNGERNEARDRESGAHGDPESGLNRRSLLGAAAGGFALAAGGLLLPAWLAEEVEAADDHPNHPEQRIRARKERQRQKHRRKVNRRQRQREKDAKRDKPGSGLTDYGITFHVELVGGRGVKIDFYSNAGYDQDFWKFTDRETLAMPGRGDPKYTFTTKDRAGALWIDDRYLVKVIKVHYEAPRLTMGFNGEFRDRTQDGWRNGTIEFDDYPRVDQGVQPMRIGGYTFTPTRHEEIKNFIIYKVTIEAPPREPSTRGRTSGPAPPAGMASSEERG